MKVVDVVPCPVVLLIKAAPILILTQGPDDGAAEAGFSQVKLGGAE